MHFLKKGQKIQAWVDPPPLIRAMPERKRFFSIDVFPYDYLLVHSSYHGLLVVLHAQQHHVVLQSQRRFNF